MTARVLFHVQHLLGTGHLRRAATIAAALVRQGFLVELVSGGMPLAGLALGGATLVQLPPMRAADPTFRVLVDAQGAPVDEVWKSRRRAMLLARLDAFAPDVVITELFPLGRRALSYELVPLVEAASQRRPRPLILASVRDILAIKTDEAKRDEMIARVRAWYDRVLVHGDRALIPLAASFPEEQIADRVVYTGYIDGEDGPKPPPGDGEDEIIVSVGGGAVGEHLLRTALAARAAGAARVRRWRILIGADLAAPIRAELAVRIEPGCIVEPARRDFRGLLRRCHVSVSQAGYNTAMDVLTTRARAVFVPFASGGESEQTQRAAALVQRGWARMVPEAELSPSRLAEAIEQAGRSVRPDCDWVRMNGAVESARLVQAWLMEQSVSV